MVKPCDVDVAADISSQFVARRLAVEIAPQVDVYIDGRVFFTDDSHQVHCRVVLCRRQSRHLI
jgi:hypothetical protein